MNTSTLCFHTGLHVSDIEASAAFYTQLLGVQPVKRKTGYAKFETDGLVLSLIEHPGGVRPDFGHFGFRVGDRAELQAHLDRLKSAGQTVREEMQTDCCYAKQDKFWVNDPDGHEWEFYLFLEDTEGGLKGQRPETAAAACCS